MHHVDVHVRRAPAGIRWPAPSGKARAREIESAPEELWRARLSEKVRAEPVEDELRLDQSGVEPFHLLAVVRADGTVLQERDRGRDLDRHRHDARVRQAEPGEAVQHLPVEVRDRHGGERDGRPSAAARNDHERVIDEVEVDLERFVPARHHRRRQSPRRHEERRIPPVVHQGCQRQPDLPDDLRPHVDRVERFLPFGVGERRPLVRGGVAHPGQRSACSQLRHGQWEFRSSLAGP